MTNLELMQSIKTKWGADIAAACATSSVPRAFVAALVANESGGDPSAKRFEPGVLTAIWKVLAGKAPAFGSISRDSLFSYIGSAVGTAPPLSASGLEGRIAKSVIAVDDLANSWGLTQVMGYYVLDSTLGWVISNTPGTLAPQLANPPIGLLYTLRRLAQCAESFELDLTKDFEQMLRCWNGGHPTAATADPQYVPNGLARMTLYQGLA